jgi:hypothetical protein
VFVRSYDPGSEDVKKGRHRRFEEARALKQLTADEEPRPKTSSEPCPECAAAPGAEHASWCLATEDEDKTEEEAW